MGKPEPAEPWRQLAADLEEILCYAGSSPDVEYMAVLLLENFHAGRYGAAPPAVPPPAPASLCDALNAAIGEPGRFAPAAPPAVPGEPRARCPPSHYASPDSPPADPTGAEPASPAAEYHATGGNPPPEVLKLVQQEYERRFPACEECGGNGWINGPVEDDARYCDACNGTGRPTGAEPGTGKP